MLGELDLNVWYVGWTWFKCVVCWVNLI